MGARVDGYTSHTCLSILAIHLVHSLSFLARHPVRQPTQRFGRLGSSMTRQVDGMDRRMREVSVKREGAAAVMRDEGR